MKTLVVGTGRCGTGYAAKLLTSAGLPCSHEGVFRPDTLSRGWKKLAAQAQAESSWLAVPVLDQVDATIIHLVRNPLEVVRSMVGIGWLARTNPGHGPYENVALRTLGCPLTPTNSRSTLIHRVGDFILDWTGLIEEAKPDALFRVEDLVIPEIQGEFLEVAGAPGTPDPINTRYNSRPRDESLNWSDLPLDIRDLAREFGYA